MCTLCHDISIYIDNLREKDLNDRIIPIGPSERKIIERILMELYCQNEDSEHYRDCLDRESVRYTCILMFVNKIQFYYKIKCLF